MHCSVPSTPQQLAAAEHNHRRDTSWLAKAVQAAHLDTTALFSFFTRRLQLGWLAEYWKAGGASCLALPAFAAACCPTAAFAGGALGCPAAPAVPAALAGTRCLYCTCRGSEAARRGGTTGGLLQMVCAHKTERHEQRKQTLALSNRKQTPRPCCRSHERRLHLS